MRQPMPDVAQRSARYLALTVAIVALVVLVVGHLAGVMPLIRPIPGGSVMVPSSGLSFTLLSCGLLLYRPDRAGRRWLRVTALAVLLIATSNLALKLAGVPRGLDGLILDPQGEGRMAIATALSFIAAACAALALTVPRLAQQPSVHALPTLGLVTASVAIIGYVVAAEPLRTTLPFAPIALHTAVLLLMLNFAVMLAAPNRGWLAIFARSPRMGNRHARRVALPILLFPACLAVLLGAAIRHGLDPEVALAAFAVVVTSVFGVLLLLDTGRMNRRDQRLTNLVTAREKDVLERSVLLAEVYHRVKNNLQQIEALLWSEARKHKGNAEVEASFRNMSDRIRAVALVHRLLLQQKNLADVSLKTFLRKLTDAMGSANDLARRGIVLKSEAPDLPVSLSSATTLGLLVNEIVANAIRHAFPGRSGTISVSLREDECDSASLRLTVADDGIGVDLAERTEGTGTRVIRGLVDQLGGRLEEFSHHGTTVVVVVPRAILEEQR